MTSEKTVYRAKWILPVQAAPIENGSITIQSDTIVDLSTNQSPTNSDSAQVVDLGEVAVIPGLVNAHTHLEFSDLEKPLGDPSLGFPSWIESVVAHRRSGNQQNPARQRTMAIQQGVAESLHAGVVAVGEIASTPWTLDGYGSQLEGIVFHEQLGNDPTQSASLASQISERVQSLSLTSWSPGISPHAPYSTSLTLFQFLVDSAAKTGTPVAMHLAETLEEVEFIETGKGPFAEMLDRMGVAFNRSGPMVTADYLNYLSQTRSLIIHGNFLNSDELELIGEFDDMYVVFCPRTHHFFGHPEYPLRTMLDLNIPVAVGTDSRASNPDLDLFEELKHIAATQPSVSPHEVLVMGTTTGASALGMSDRFGSIDSGKSAKLCVVRNPDTSGSPEDWLFSPDSTCQPLSSFVASSL